jgi:hypothetical protein
MKTSFTLADQEIITDQTISEGVVKMNIATRIHLWMLGFVELRYQDKITPFSQRWFVLGNEIVTDQTIPKGKIQMCVATRHHIFSMFPVRVSNARPEFPDSSNAPVHS